MKYIDLDLPSGTLWAESFFQTSIFDLIEEQRALMPTYQQYQELLDYCTFSYHDNYTLVERNGKQIKLPPRDGSEIRYLITQSKDSLTVIWNRRVYLVSIHLNQTHFAHFVRQ
jgi:hypothetical protein